MFNELAIKAPIKECTKRGSLYLTGNDVTVMETADWGMSERGVSTWEVKSSLLFHLKGHWLEMHEKNRFICKSVHHTISRPITH